LATVLAEAARRYPDKIAVVDPMVRVSYRDLWAESLAYAAGLRELGIGKGDKVYALLREAMLEAGVIGIARVVWLFFVRGAATVHLIEQFPERERRFGRQLWIQLLE